MICTAYFDASGKKESPALAVAGFLTPTFQWLKFERDWKYCLAWNGVTELHMKDFAHSRGEFLSWKGDELRRKRFMEELIRTIKDHVDNSFAVSVHMPDYKEVDCEYGLRESAHPYALAGVHCIELIKTWTKKYGYDPSLVDYVFEDGDEGKGDLFRLSSENYQVNPIFKKKCQSVAFQAGDLIAYEQYKANLKLISEPEWLLEIGDFRMPFQSLMSIPGSASWSVMTKENLIENCRILGIPPRNH